MPRIRAHPSAAVLALTLAACATESMPGEPNVCSDPGRDPSFTTGRASPVDHITIAVSDLGAAVAAAEVAGFTIKPGRNHQNGIRNAHIKFHDGASIELLTVDSVGTDALSTEYADIIRTRPGGAFVAIAAKSASAALEEVRAIGGSPTLESGQGWNYVNFAPGSPLRHIYFIEMKVPVSDTDSVLTHANGAAQLLGVELRGGPAVAALLVALGGVECVRDATAVFEVDGVEFTPAAPSVDSPRIRTVYLGRSEASGGHRDEPRTRLLLGGTTVEVY